MTRLAIALTFVLAFAFLPAFPTAADCVEDPNGGCLGATLRPTVRPTPTPIGQTPAPTPTPRSAAITATIACAAALHYNRITVTISYTGATELWSASDFGIRQEASGTGSGPRTVVFYWDASFNYAEFYLMAPGTRGPEYADAIASAGPVHYVCTY